MTKVLHLLLSEHREASHQYIISTMTNTPSIKDIDLHQIAQFRGQVHAFDLVLDLPEFLKEKTEVKNG